jgi:sensor histidine kinase regulating citrate/malate metabolism
MKLKLSREDMRDHVKVKKAAIISIAANVVEIIAGLVMLVLVRRMLTGGGEESIARMTTLLCVTIVGWGAIMDIGASITSLQMVKKAQELEEAYGQLDSLNREMRAQRHDFMNHLQVVFSLLELKESDEAMQYVESVYGDIKRTGSVLKTAIPAVNALIAAKRQDCEAQGIALALHIGSSWQGLPVPGWEMCRVLGNLIDNAREALLAEEGATDRRIDLTIDETPGAYTFRVGNNGPAIPPQLHRSIFQLGFTTKSEGHGSGLSIVEEILRSYDGEIRVESDEDSTVFIGTIPKKG